MLHSPHVCIIARRVLKAENRSFTKTLPHALKERSHRVHRTSGVQVLEVCKLGWVQLDQYLQETYTDDIVPPLSLGLQREH